MDKLPVFRFSLGQFGWYSAKAVFRLVVALLLVEVLLFAFVPRASYGVELAQICAMFTLAAWVAYEAISPSARLSDQGLRTLTGMLKDWPLETQKLAELLQREGYISIRQLYGIAASCQAEYDKHCALTRPGAKALLTLNTSPGILLDLKEDSHA